MTHNTEAKKALPDTALILELFDFPDDRPKAIVLVPRACPSAEVIEAIQKQNILKNQAGLWRQCGPDSLSSIAWLQGDWNQSNAKIGTKAVTILTPKIVPAAKPVDAGGQQEIVVNDPACFVSSEFMFPKLYRAKDLEIRAHLSSIQAGAMAIAFSEDPATPKKYAARWTVNGKAWVFYLCAPANLPPALLHALLVAGAKKLSRYSGTKVDLAGPVELPKFDPRLQVTRWNYSLSLRKTKVPLTVYLPQEIIAGTLGLFPDSSESENPPMGPNNLLFDLCRINRRSIDAQAKELLLPIDINDRTAVCNAICDAIDVFERHDLTLLVQNHLLPKATESILDYFFPQGQYDAYIWNKLKPLLGEIPATSLAFALKQNKNAENKLTLEHIKELIAAVASGKLELGYRASNYIKYALGNAIDGESRQLLDKMVEAKLPLMMLEMIPPLERMKALAKLTDRERSMCLFGDKNAPQLLMQAFSQKGKQREQDDYNLMLKQYERGEISSAMIIQAKTEACQFIAEHYVSTNMGKASELDWKTLFSKLQPETASFLIGSSKSCLAEITNPNLKKYLASQKYKPKEPNPITDVNSLSAAEYHYQFLSATVK